MFFMCSNEEPCRYRDNAGAYDGEDDPFPYGRSVKGYNWPVHTWVSGEVKNSEFHAGPKTPGPIRRYVSPSGVPTSESVAYRAVLSGALPRLFLKRISTGDLADGTLGFSLK